MRPPPAPAFPKPWEETGLFQVCQSIQQAPRNGFILRPSLVFPSRRVCCHLPFTRRKLRQGAGLLGCTQLILEDLGTGS